MQERDGGGDRSEDVGSVVLRASAMGPAASPGDNFPGRRFPCGERVWLRACSVGEGSVALQVTSGGARERRLGFAPDIA